MLACCRAESHAEPSPSREPPVESPGAIPDAPLNGTVRGAPFVVRDARYVVDRRLGYAHTDILLSSAKADTPCGPLAQSRATSVWLRLEGAGAVEPKEWRIGPAMESPWSVHYQIFDGESWIGVAANNAVLAIREATPDGHLSGGLASCFPDDDKSCVSGSFEALNCPTSLDQPVRGAVPPEAIPSRYLEAVRSSTRPGGDAGR